MDSKYEMQQKLNLGFVVSIQSRNLWRQNKAPQKNNNKNWIFAWNSDNWSLSTSFQQMCVPHLLNFSLKSNYICFAFKLKNLKHNFSTSSTSNIFWKLYRRRNGYFTYSVGRIFGIHHKHFYIKKNSQLHIKKHGKKKNGRVYQKYLGTFLKNANVQTLLFLSKDPDVFLMSIHF